MSENGGMDIIEFLEARIAEDESAALRHMSDASAVGFGDYPARILAECASKRWVLNALRSYEPDTEWDTQPDMGKRGNNAAGAVRRMAVIYKDHPDYQQEWEV